MMIQMKSVIGMEQQRLTYIQISDQLTMVALPHSSMNNSCTFSIFSANLFEKKWVYLNLIDKIKTAKQCIGKHKQKYEPRTKECTCRMSLSHAYAREFNARISLWMMISHRWSNNNMMITMECCGMCCCGGVDTLIVLVLHQMSSPEHYFAHFHSKYFIFVYILKWYWEQCNFLHDLFVWPLFCSVRKDAVIRMKYSSIIIF